LWLACARLGVIHSEVFGGFSGTACGDRIADSGSHILVTMDGYYRNEALTDHKAKADEAVAAAAMALTRGLSAELAPRSIRVVGLRPRGYRRPAGSSRASSRTPAHRA
jgi:acyl-coenzyme A synthetase/AMP-(fatty) acid ligase